MDVLVHNAGVLCVPSHPSVDGALQEDRRALGTLCERLTEDPSHDVRHHEVEYPDGKVFLEPHPRALMLRNHV